jgi:hypothetical protein
MSRPYLLSAICTVSQYFLCMSALFPVNVAQTRACPEQTPIGIVGIERLSSTKHRLLMSFFTVLTNPLSLPGFVSVFPLLSYL